MININIVAVGNLKEKFWQDASKEYEKRLSRFCKLNIIELAEQNKFDNIDKILETEGQEIVKTIEKLGGKSYLLAIGGKQLSSEEFSNEIENSSLLSSTINFVIGGSYGTSKQVAEKIKNTLSFGKATYPHNLARIILLEQVYRAFMLTSGGKYHK